MPNQKTINQREANLLDQRPVAQRGPPQRQFVDDTNLPPVANQPVIDDPTPVRHFEPNPLLEITSPDREPQEAARQHPVQDAGNPNVTQDPFETQMEVPFTEDTVEPVFKRPEMADFEIPQCLRK